MTLSITVQSNESTRSSQSHNNAVGPKYYVKYYYQLSECFTIDGCDGALVSSAFTAV